MSKVTNSENPLSRSPRLRTVLTKIKEKTENKKLNKKEKKKTKVFLPVKIGVVLFSLLIAVIVCLSIRLIDTNKEVDNAYSTILAISSQKTQLEKDKEELVKSNKVTKDALTKSEEKVAELEKQLADKKTKVETVTKKTETKSTTKQKVTENTTAAATAPETTTTQSSGYKTDEYGKYYERTMRITNYCSCAKCCGKYAYNRPKDENGKDIVYTASGKRAKQMYTLGASSVYPFGTKMYIPGVGICEVMDRGSGVTSAYHLDMYFESHQAALNYGNHTLTVRIYV